MGNHSSNIMDCNKSDTGYLYLYIGPMYAGKSSKLIQCYNKGIENQEHVIVLTHSNENRYSNDEVSTHDLVKVKSLKYNSIDTFIQEQQFTLTSCDTILIDEAQFFPDLMKCIELVEKYNKSVYIFGLDGDFQRQKFGNILDLIPFCDKIEKLYARCHECNNNAIFSHRIIKEKEQIVVGNKDIYIPLCRKCYKNKQ